MIQVDIWILFQRKQKHEKNTCTPIFMASLMTIAKIQKPSKDPWIDHWKKSKKKLMFIELCLWISLREERLVLFPVVLTKEKIMWIQVPVSLYFLSFLENNQIKRKKMWKLFSKCIWHSYLDSSNLPNSQQFCT